MNYNYSMNRELYEDIKYGTNIIPEDEYISTLITIADVASEMVVKTLGPYGKTTMLNDGVSTYPTKDGWSVLKTLRFNDPVFNVLYGVLKQVSFNMVSIVGDNTTGSFVAAVKFMHRVIDHILSQGYRQADVVHAIKAVGDRIIDRLENSEYVKHCNDKEYNDIKMIAHVASNGDDDLAKMIQTIYQKTNNPNIFVTIGSSVETSYEIQTGYKFDCNPIMQKLYINSDDRTYEEINPALMMIFDHNVTYREHSRLISSISSYASGVNKTVFLLAPYFDDVISNVMGSSIESLSQQGQVPNIMMIQVPLSNSQQRACLSDMVLLTNGQILDYGKVRAFNLMVHKAEHPDEKLEDALLNTAEYNFKSTNELIETCAGHTRKIIVGKKYILLQDYESVVNQNVYAETLKNVKEEYEEAYAKMNKSTTNLHKEYMDAYQHYTKLNGSLGVIKVGGLSELEKLYTKDVVDDAVLACRSAYDHGYVRGLNLTMMNVIFELQEDESTKLEGAITNMFFDTFYSLSLEVFKNARGSDLEFEETVYIYSSNGDSTVEQMTPRKILEYCIKNKAGYNMVTNEIMPDACCPIINSVKSDTETIRAIIGILSVVLTSNQFLTVNRAYDRTIGLKQKQETIQKSEAAKWGCVAEEVAGRLLKIPAIKNIVKTIHK